MLITKVLETTLDLLKPNDIYQAAADENVLLHKLRDKFEHKCFMSMLIVSINKIVRRSAIRSVDNRLDGGASVDIQFEVTGVVFTQGEILHDCKIIEIHQPGTITAEHEYASIKLQKDQTGQISKTLVVGQKIPVIVHKVKYNIHQSTVSMIATAYVSAPTPNVYYNITAGLNADEEVKLANIFGIINEELELHKKISSEKAYTFFREIMYPYKVNQKFEMSKTAETFGLKPVILDLPLISKINSGIIVYPSEDNRANVRLFHMISNNIPDGSVMVIDSPLYSAMVDIMNKYLFYLKGLRGFVETYPTLDKVQANAMYWRLYMSKPKMTSNEITIVDMIKYITHNVGDLSKTERIDILQMIINASIDDSKIKEKGGGSQIRFKDIPPNTIIAVYNYINTKLNHKIIALEYVPEDEIDDTTPVN